MSNEPSFSHFCSVHHDNRPKAPTMDAWQCIAERNDAIRRWAELEGKSAQMTDELYRRRVAMLDKHVYWPVTAGLLLRLAAWAVETWWQTRG